MKTSAALLVLAGLIAPAISNAQTPNSGPPGPGARVKSGDFVFSFLPKAFQANPIMETTVITEMSDFGKTLPLPTAANPTYYVIQSSGFQARGQIPAGEKSPSPAELEKTLMLSLSQNHYIRAEPPLHQPTLLVVYFWGSHSKLDRETAANFPEKEHEDMLERAVLVGGKKFAQDFERTSTFGEGPQEQMNKARYLRDQTEDDLYYLVASAYGFTREGRKLIWRTSMTVNARGLSMTETLSPLLMQSAPFLGKPMAEPELASARIVRNGHVELGTPVVVPEKKQ